MRDLKECQAEVFRRSEIKITKRKRRNRRILAVCVPVALCIGGWLMLPKNREVPETTMVQEVCQSSTENRLIQEISITGVGISLQYTEEAQTLPIYDYLTGDTLQEDIITRGDPMEAPEGAVPEDNYENGSALTDAENKLTGDIFTKYSATAEYRIAVTLADGSRQEYLLTGNLLTDQVTGAGYSLTDTQLAELLTLLGITIP